MPHYLIDVQHLTHNCAGSSAPHVVETWRSIVDTIPTGPCTNPQPSAPGTDPARIDCGVVLVPDRRCPSCTVTITIRSTKTTYLGTEPTCTNRAPSGLLPDPCPSCGLLVSALLADTGRHLLCPA